MKRIFTIILSLAFTSILSAQQGDNARRNFNQSRLSISLNNNMQYMVLVDGRNVVNRNNQQGILINDIRPGNHSVKIYRLSSGRQYDGRRPDRNRRLIYESNLNIRPNYHVDITINRFGRVFLDERHMSGNYFTDFDDDGFGGNGWGDYGNFDQSMNSQSFSQFIQMLKGESFENTRLSLARQTISANQFTAVQVKEIMQQFSFDNNRLEIAKFSYKNTIDKNNYFLLNDVFSFSSNKEELARYIQNYR